MRITPGHDFQPHDTPTKALLGLMACNMSVYDISILQLDTGIILITVSDDSQPSLTGEGWLWYDGRGNLWGRTSHGQVIVRKGDGGWESNRYPQGNGNTASSFKFPGEMLQVGELVAGNSNESNTVFVAQTGGFNTGATWHPGVSQDTSASTADQIHNYHRIVFMGATRFYAPDFLPSTFERARVTRATANSPFWVMINAETANVPAYYGDCSRTDPDLHADYAYMYFFQAVLAQ